MRDPGHAHRGRVIQAPLSESSVPGSSCSWRPWVLFRVSPSIQGAEALRTASAVGPSGRLQAVGGPAGKEAAFCKGRPWSQEEPPLGGGRCDGVWRVLQQLVEDIIEEVKVVVAEEQEKVSVQEQEEAPEEQGQDWGLEGPAPNGGAVVLSALQVELNSANEQEPRATVKLWRKDHQRRKHPLHQRSAIIQGLAGFWANPVS